VGKDAVEASGNKGRSRFLFGMKPEKQQQTQIRGFSPFDYAQGQNDKLCFCLKR
jgi:hypothetical protein